MRVVEDIFKKYYPIPDRAHLHATNRCNLRCIHCLEVNRSSNGELSLKEIKGIFDQLADLGCFRIVISGGEPLMRRDICGILDYGFKKGFIISILTNGTLLNEAIVERLCNHPSSVQVSLYSLDPAVHESITGVKGSFEKSMDSIMLLRDKGIKFRIVCIVMQQNWKAIPAMERFSKRYKIHSDYSLLIYPRINRDPEPIQYRLRDRDLREVLTLQYFRKTFKRRNLSSKEERIKLLKWLFDQQFNYCYISSDGKVCPSLIFREEAGDLRKDPLASIWRNSSLFRRLREVKGNEFACHCCRDLDLCCPRLCVAYLESGDMFAKPLESCRITEIFVSSMNMKRR